MSVKNKHRIQTGDMMLFSYNGKSPFTWLIKKMQGNKWTHGGVACIIHDEIYVCESTFSGAGITTLEHYIDKGYDIKILKLKSDILRSRQKRIQQVMTTFMLQMCGNRSYDFANLFIYQPIKYVYRWCNGKFSIKNDSNSAQKMMCSEYATYVHHHFFGLFPEWYGNSPHDIDQHPDYEHFEVQTISKK